MGKFKSLVGRVFGKLSVIGEERVNGRLLRKCRCCCGTEVLVTGGALVGGNSKSCGCGQRDAARKNLLRHGERYCPEYRVWLNMRDRCRNKNNDHYKYYGGRGIRVCVEWDNFVKFLHDMGRRPSPRHYIDRINNNKGYCKENCRWVTNRFNCRNKSNNRLLTHKGISAPMIAWAEFLGINKSTLWTRLDSGWSVERALSVRCMRGKTVSKITDKEYEEFRNRLYKINLLEEIK